MKLMADFINREALRNELYDADAITMRGVAILNNFPSADVVQVVRCKDCKHWEDGYFGYCTKTHTAMDYDAFCSYGERREGE